MDRKRVKTQDGILAQTPVIVQRELREPALELISILGQTAVPILDEIGISMQEGRSIVAPRNKPPTQRNVTDSGDDASRYLYGGFTLSSGRSYRPSDQISYGTIDDMTKSGMVIFTLAIKQSAIHNVLRDPQAWIVESESERAKRIVRGMMQTIFRDYGAEFMTYMPYGSAFFEKEWELRRAGKWGVKGVNGDLWGYSALKSIHPASVDHIRFKDNGHTFNGFVQNKIVSGQADVVTDKSLILTYDKKFRNLWGNPATEPMYPYWFWLEVTWRSFLQYLERTGAPVTVVYAPGKGKILTPDDVHENSMKYALAQAAYVNFSRSAAFPSDVDPDTGQQLWRVEYLQDQSRGDQFIAAIRELGTAMARSVVIGDNAATQSQEAGSFASAQTHWMVTQLDNQAKLDELLEQINLYVVEPSIRYNLGEKADPAWIRTQVLDQQHLDRLFKLLNTMGNQPDAHAMERINWDLVLESNRIPTLTEEEIDKNREEQLKKAVDQQKAFAKVSQETQRPLARKEQANGQQRKPPVPTGQNRIQQSHEGLMYHLANGTCIPVHLTDEQAAELVDRTTERPKVFDMQASEETDLDAEIEKIVEEVMSEIDTEGLSEKDLSDLRKRILGILGFAEAKLEASDLVIELALRDLLRKVISKVRSVIDRVVKRVTGKDLADWKGTRAASPGRGKFVPSGGTVITKDGRVWREEDHPRDASGKFAEKGAEGAKKAGDEDRAPSKKYTEAFSSDNWTEEADGRVTIEIDGYGYVAVGEINAELFAKIHETQLRIKDRAEKLGYPLEADKIPLTIINWSNREAALESVRKSINPDATMEQLDAYLEETGGQMAYIGFEGITIDSKLAEESPGLFESVLFHEKLHGQPREKEGSGARSMYYDPDEIFTTILSLYYAEQNGLPGINGYPVWVSWAAQAAIEKGMSKQELYEYALSAHKADGGREYEVSVENLVSGTSVFMFQVDDEGGVKWDRHMASLDQTWPGWDDELRSLANIYGIDFDDMMRSLLILGD